MEALRSCVTSEQNETLNQLLHPGYLQARLVTGDALALGVLIGGHIPDR